MSIPLVLVLEVIESSVRSFVVSGGREVHRGSGRRPGSVREDTQKVGGDDGETQGCETVRFWVCETRDGEGRRRTSRGLHSGQTSPLREGHSAFGGGRDGRDGVGWGIRHSHRVRRGCYESRVLVGVFVERSGVRCRWWEVPLSRVIVCVLDRVSSSSRLQTTDTPFTCLTEDTQGVLQVWSHKTFGFGPSSQNRGTGSKFWFGLSRDIQNQLISLLVLLLCPTNNRGVS